MSTREQREDSEFTCPDCEGDFPMRRVPEMVHLLDELEAAESTHRDLTSRLGFGGNKTEPMADNDTIINWYMERLNEASEWAESQSWRLACMDAGHPDDED